MVGPLGAGTLVDLQIVSICWVSVLTVAPSVELEGIAGDVPLGAGTLDDSQFEPDCSFKALVAPNFPSDS